MDANKALELATIAFPNDTEMRSVYMLGLDKGYELCKEQMMKEAVEGRLFVYSDGSYELIGSLDFPKDSKFKDGDKVKLIIIKEEEK